MGSLDTELKLAIMGLEYAQELNQGRMYFETYMQDLRSWWNRWGRVYNLVLEGIDTTTPMDWPATAGNLQQGSWSDTPCDCFRDVPYTPCTGNSVHDID